MKKIILIITAMVLLAPANIYSQDCTDYHQYHCLFADFTFFYSRQSKSSLFKPGQSKDVKIIAYSGEDYYVSVCAHRKFGKIRFRLLEDNEGRKVFYDNATDNYSESIIFSNDVTRNMIIEVSVPDGDENTGDEARCVGVVVEFRKTDGQ